MQVFETRHGGPYVRAFVSFLSPDDDALFDDICLRQEVLGWLRQVMPHRYVIQADGRYSLLLFQQTNDAIHFKLRWS